MILVLDVLDPGSELVSSTMGKLEEKLRSLLKSMPEKNGVFAKHVSLRKRRSVVPQLVEIKKK